MGAAHRARPGRRCPRGPLPPRPRAPLGVRIPTPRDLSPRGRRGGEDGQNYGRKLVPEAKDLEPTTAPRSEKGGIQYFGWIIG